MFPSLLKLNDNSQQRLNNPIMGRRPLITNLLIQLPKNRHLHMHIRQPKIPPIYHRLQIRYPTYFRYRNNNNNIINIASQQPNSPRIIQPRWPFPSRSIIIPKYVIFTFTFPSTYKTFTSIIT